MKSCVHALALSSQVRRSAAIGLASLALLCGSASAISTIQPLHWYRMGDALEIDPGALPMIDVGTPAPILHDSLNGAELQAIGAPGTIAAQTSIPEYRAGISTQRSLTVPSTSSGYTGGLLSADTGDFEFEGWVQIPGGRVSRNMCLACNGTPGVDGWSIYLEKGPLTSAGNVVVRYGATTVASGSLPGSYVSDPVQFALVHSHATGEYLVINGAKTLVQSTSLAAPTGHFTLGAIPDGAGGYKDFFTGNLDEIRFSRLLTLDPSDAWLPLLSSAPDIKAFISGLTVFSELRHSGEIDLGEVGISAGSSYLVVAAKSSYAPASGALIIQGITLGGPDAADFQLENSQSFPVADFIGAGAISSLNFNPKTPGPKTVTLTVTSNDPENIAC